MKEQSALNGRGRMRDAVCHDKQWGGRVQLGMQQVAPLIVRIEIQATRGQGGILGILGEERQTEHGRNLRSTRPEARGLGRFHMTSEAVVVFVGE